SSSAVVGPSRSEGSMKRVALLGLLVGCAANTTTAEGPRRSSVVCDAASLDRSTRHRELSLSLVSSQPPQAILDAARRLDIPGLEVQYESSSPTYANATWRFPSGSNVDLHAIQTAMDGVNVQSANLSESDYSPQVVQQCDRLRLLEDAATAIDDALAQAHGRVAEALLTE